MMFSNNGIQAALEGEREREGEDETALIAKRASGRANG